MNRWAVLVVSLVAASLVGALIFRPTYAEASILFGAVALFSAPIVVNRVESASTGVGLLVGLAIFSSFPVEKLYRVEEQYGFVGDFGLTLAFALALFLFGGGWRRSWKGK